MKGPGTGQLQARIELDLLELLYDNTPNAYSSVVVAVALTVLAWNPTRPWPLVAWAALVVTVSMARIGLAALFRRQRRDSLDCKRWRRYGEAGTLLAGLAWGACTYPLLMPQYQAYSGLFIVAIAITYIGVANAYASWPSVPAAFALGAVPQLVLLFVLGEGVSAYVGLLIPLYLVWSSRMTRVIHSYLVNMAQLRYANLDLAEDYRRQKLEADAANASKSRFLAAASHDLRQPLHALGLLTSNLRTAAGEAQRRQLLDQMDALLEGMDKQFHALLDVSRLDAGVVQPQPASFAASELLDGIARDYTAEAAAKGVALRVRASPLVLHSDPVLLGQVLRNLVSNAIRYTDRGRVVVACRRAGPGHARLVVRDTGRGIPPDQQENVFQEFFQLPHSDRDRGKGMGLGLAIVRRISRLLACPVQLRSVPGRGSLFGVTVPLSNEAPQQKMAARAEGLGNAVFAECLVAVLDDDQAIVENTRALLASWGCDVVAATRYEELEAGLRAAGRAPQLLLFDYHTGRAQDGVVLARRLLATLATPAPVVIITGDTAPAHLARLRASGFHVLTKPVRPSKLRAVVAHMLQQPASRPADASLE